jgi:hypothetical protein
MADVYIKSTGQYKTSVSDSRYMDTGSFILYPSFDPDKNTVLSYDPKYRKTSGNAVTTMSISEMEAIGYLDELKTQRYEQIDFRTAELINNGFTFDSSSFSLSLAAQSNWTNIYGGQVALSASGNFPMNVTTIDNDEYSLAYEDVTMFWLTAVGTVKAHYDSGRSLKKSIFDASGSAQVNSIIDTR